MTQERQRRRIIRLLRKIIRASRENIIAIEWWNANRTDQPPLDCETDRVAVKLARDAMAAFLKGDRKAKDVAFGRMREHLRAMEKEQADTGD